MQKWIQNGVFLAWLKNPEDQQAIIYRIGGSIETKNSFEEKLSGENVLPGFELHLQDPK